MKQYLECDSPEHAEAVDQFIMESLRDRYGTQGSEWSGVWTDGMSYGVLWAAPATQLFGTPEDDPSVIVIDDEAEEWTRLEVPDPEVPDPEVPVP